MKQQRDDKGRFMSNKKNKSISRFDEIFISIFLAAGVLFIVAIAGHISYVNGEKSGYDKGYSENQTTAYNKGFSDGDNYRSRVYEYNNWSTCSWQVGYYSSRWQTKCKDSNRVALFDSEYNKVDEYTFPVFVRVNRF